MEGARANGRAQLRYWAKKMIDPKNGRISVSGECEITGTLKKSVFISSELFRSAKPLVSNPPFASYTISEQRVDERSYMVSLWFEAESLRSVHIAYTGVEFGTSWTDWSEEKERNKQQQHDRLLASILGESSDYHFSWGRVESVFDQKSGSSSIVVTYKRDR